MDERVKRALWTVQRACSGRELCRTDVIARLKRFNLSEKETQEIIDSLEEDGFLNQERYTKSFVKDKASLSGWGPLKISFALKKRGIPEELIKDALNELKHAGVSEKLSDILSRKYKLSDKERDKQKLRAKLIRFGLSRGFEYGEVISQVNKLMANFVTEIND